MVQEKIRHSKWVREVRKNTPPPNLVEYSRQWEAFFDEYAGQVDQWHRRNAGYHNAIASVARFYLPGNASVLEIGSGNGDLLAALQPSRGIGIDISGQMVSLATKKYPWLEFRQMGAESLDLPKQSFDFIVLSDVLGYLYD